MGVVPHPKGKNQKSSRSLVTEKFDWQKIDPEWPVVGVDEVGRGCLAGPVYAGAVYLNIEKPWKHYTDSKKLSALRREQMAEQIHGDHMVGIGFATVEEIAQINILQASLLAMKRAVLHLMQKMDCNRAHLLIDGNQPIVDFAPGGINRQPSPHFKQTCLIKGDLRAEPVAAASIVAKVARDQLLVELATQYPGYGLEVHKGYATAYHQQAIARLGPCSIHRRTFAGVREYWQV